MCGQDDDPSQHDTAPGADYVQERPGATWCVAISDLATACGRPITRNAEWFTTSTLPVYKVCLDCRSGHAVCYLPDPNDCGDPAIACDVNRREPRCDPHLEERIAFEFWLYEWLPPIRFPELGDWRKVGPRASGAPVPVR